MTEKSWTADSQAEMAKIIAAQARVDWFTAEQLAADVADRNFRKFITETRVVNDPHLRSSRSMASWQVSFETGKWRLSRMET